MQGADKGTPNAWDARKKDLVTLLGKLELDAFGAQEVRRNQARYIKKYLPGFAYVGDFRNKDRKGGEASPVFYRKDRLEAEKSGTFWLSKTPDVPGSKGWDARYPRICTWVRFWREKEVLAVEALKFPREYRNPPRVGSPNYGKVEVKMYCGQYHCGPRIDFIYVSPGVTVKSYATHADPRPGMEYYPSDHFPVTADIEL